MTPSERALVAAERIAEEYPSGHWRDCPARTLPGDCCSCGFYEAMCELKAALSQPPAQGERPEVEARISNALLTPVVAPHGAPRSLFVLLEQAGFKPGDRVLVTLVERGKDSGGMWSAPGWDLVAAISEEEKKERGK